MYDKALNCWINIMQVKQSINHNNRQLFVNFYKYSITNFSVSAKIFNCDLLIFQYHNRQIFTYTMLPLDREMLQLRTHT